MKSPNISHNPDHRQKVAEALANFYDVPEIPECAVLPVLHFTMLAVNASEDELRRFIRMTEH